MSSMSARQSARLKAVEVIATAAKSGLKRSSAKKTAVEAVAVEAAVDVTTNGQSDHNKETASSPPAKKAKADSAKEKTAPATPTTSGSAAKDAWGALFAKKSSASKNGGAGRVQPKPAQAVSSEMQAKIDGYAKFDGLTPRSDATKLKIAAWNVNGLRALLKKEEAVRMRAYLAQEDPDVLCISETKIDKDELQKLENIWSQYEHQYWSCAAKKGYSGTAILSKTKPLSVKDEIVVEGKKIDDEGRFLALEYDKFWLVHTYVPNAGAKLDRLDFRTKQWDQAMLRMLQELEKTKPVVWCGDLNVAHQEIDIHDPKSNRNKSPGFTDAERESFGSILDSGFVDTFRQLHPEEQQFSYYSYRFNARAKNKGWRLDYFLVSQALMSKVVRTRSIIHNNNKKRLSTDSNLTEYTDDICMNVQETSLIRTSVTGSDHVPVILELQEL